MSFLTCTTAFDVKTTNGGVQISNSVKNLQEYKITFSIPFYTVSKEVFIYYQYIKTCLQVLIEFYLVYQRNICFLHILNHSKYQSLSVSHFLR